MVKDSNNDRFGLNNELKQFVKDNKEFNFLQNQAYFDPDDRYYYNFVNNDKLTEEYLTILDTKTKTSIPNNGKRFLCG